MLKKNLLFVLALCMLGVAMTNPRLFLTDGVTEVNLLGGIKTSGYDINGWFQQIPQFKGGGVIQNSSLATGQRLIDSRFGSITDEFPLAMMGADDDHFARIQQDLVRLLEKAADYWRTDWYSLPVWLERRASCETEISYALVNFGSIAELSEQMTADFGRDSAQAGLALHVNHGIWRSHKPGDSECVELSTEQDYFMPAAEVTVAASPTAISDDFSAVSEFNLFNVVGNTARMGRIFGIPNDVIYDAGVRFTGVNVPQGATIVDAYITFEADALTSAAQECNLIIFQQKEANPATFSTWNDWYAREVGPMASMLWFNVEGWVPGNFYTTPNMFEVVQQIIDLPSWVSGNAMAFWFRDAASDSSAYRDWVTFDGAPASPVLTIVYAGTDTTLGRSETCLNENYVANHSKLANITNYYTRTNGNAWSGNLQGAGLPHLLLPPTLLANGDSGIFGIDTDLAQSGPFTSAVFDVAITAVYGGNASCIWQYWNGAAWAALAVTDNTGGGFASIQPFENIGVNSVHWKAPSDWTIGNLNTIFGGGAPNVNGYWIRILCSIPISPGDFIATPTQRNRLVYTISWPRVDIAADQVPGDIEALAKHVAYNQSDKYLGLSDPTLPFGRVVVGLRSMSRGEDFNAYINLSDEQNTPGITVAPIGMSSFVDDVQAPTGRAIFGVANPAANISFSPSLARQYQGRYTAILRVNVDGAATPSFRLGIKPYVGVTGVVRYLPWAIVSSPAQWRYAELGTLIFPGTSTAPDEQLELPQLIINTKDASGTGVYFYDLIVMPTDEWFGSFGAIPYGWSYSIHNNRRADIDSLDDPKQQIRSIVKDASSEMATMELVPIANGQVQLSANSTQRLWFWFAEEAFTSKHLSGSVPEIAASVQSFRVSRYLGLRGDR